HVKKFIATHYVMEASNSAWNQQQSFYAAGNKDEGNPYDSKNSLTEEEKANTEKQTIRGKYLSVVIAKNLSMDINQFNKYNPGFDAKLSAQGEYDLLLPADKMQQFLANKYQILNECVNSILGDEPLPPAKTTYPKAGRKKSP
ncbi:MAG TPA: hypothetical protein DCQ34_01950, partial [Chitinophagaceae bacterium]|nr:hypothetical protein [Chitinophagaceae bacterium]